VRLPKEFRFVGSKVLIKHAGSAVVLLPKPKSWDPLLSSLEHCSDDYLNDREQPIQRTRESLG
jgi:antitoxin VapB